MLMIAFTLVNVDGLYLQSKNWKLIENKKAKVLN